MMRLAQWRRGPFSQQKARWLRHRLFAHEAGPCSNRDKEDTRN